MAKYREFDKLTNALERTFYLELDANPRNTHKRLFSLLKECLTFWAENAGAYTTCALFEEGDPKVLEITGLPADTFKEKTPEQYLIESLENGFYCFDSRSPYYCKVFHTRAAIKHLYFSKVLPCFDYGKVVKAYLLDTFQNRTQGASKKIIDYIKTMQIKKSDCLFDCVELVNSQE